MINVTPGAYSLTGSAAQMLASRRLEVAPGSYSITGSDADLSVDAGALVLSIDPGSYALTGFAADLRRNARLEVSPGSYSLTGSPAQMSVGRRIEVSPGSYSITGSPAALIVGRLLLAEPGAYVLTGSDADLVVESPDKVLNVDPGAYVLTGFDAQFVYSGDIVPRRRHAGTRKNYIIKGQKYALTDYELALLIQQMLNEVKRPEVQVVNEKEVKQISRKVWKRLKESLSNLEALSLETVQEVVESNLIEYDDEDDELLMLL